MPSDILKSKYIILYQKAYNCNIDEYQIERYRASIDCYLWHCTNMVPDNSFLRDFLEEAQCVRYLQQFIEFRLTESDQLKHLDREILTAMGIKKIGDKIRILQQSRNLRENSNSVEKQVRQMQLLVEEMSAMCVGTVPDNEELVTERHCAIFIVNNGSAKKVNLNGCFNADSIKKRLIKRLPPELLAQNTAPNAAPPTARDYDVFVVDYAKNILHLLYDVELVTICHSADRLEKNRLIFISKNQTPSDQAIFTSRKLYLKTLGPQFSANSGNLSTSSMSQRYRKISLLGNGEGYNLQIEDTKDKIRQVFDQRPPSELISTNIAGYFPAADIHKLESALRESYRQSVRMSLSNGKNLKADSNKIGYLLLKHSNAVDYALLESVQLENKNGDPKNFESLSKPPLQQARSLSHSNRSEDRIELMHIEPQRDEDLLDDDEVVSLPTQISTPKNWLKGARIGSGSFGSVYLGMNAQTGELMAVKQVEIRSTSGRTADERPSADKSEGSSMYRKMVEALEHEMNLLKDLHHENIVTYYGSSHEGKNLNIFLEYVPGGSVASMLNSYGPFEESLIMNFTRQILIGVAYLHKKNIIHRDIKGANILIDIKGCVKITDFGISKKLSPFNQQENKRASLQGSVYWMAPEVVKQTATTAKADIWSTGCVVIEMFTGKHPFPDFTQMQAIFKIGTNKTPEFPSWSSELAQMFLSKAFELDYKQRPSAIEMLKHKWLEVRMV